MKLFKLLKTLFIQGFIDAWNFRELTNTVFYFGVKNEYTDVWFAIIMLKHYFRIFFHCILNLVMLIIPVVILKLFLF